MQLPCISKFFKYNIGKFLLLTSTAVQKEINLQPLTKTLEICSYKINIYIFDAYFKNSKISLKCITRKNFKNIKRYA